MSKSSAYTNKVRESPAAYYDRHGILSEIADEPADIALGDAFREEVLTGQHRRRLKNVSIKLDPAQIVAVRKIAVMKALPYQSLIRHFVAEGIKRELQLKAS